MGNDFMSKNLFFHKQFTQEICIENYGICDICKNRKEMFEMVDSMPYGNVIFPPLLFRYECKTCFSEKFNIDEE